MKKEKKKGSCLKTLLIVFGVFIIIGIIGNFAGRSDEDTSTTNPPASENTDNSQEDAPGTSDLSSDSNTTPDEDENVPAENESNEDENIPTEYKSALNRAYSYSETMHMSKAGIYNQLTSEYGEKFSAEAAQYAIDNMDVDWNANALAKAKDYSDSMYMSKAGIYDQLTSEYGEKFTADEAQYAVDHVDADWKFNALQKAKTYQESMDMSPEAIRDQLSSEYGEKFTQEEADYAVENLN